MGLIGFGLPDDRLLGPNEKFHLPNFRKGIETGILFLAEVAASGDRRRVPAAARGKPGPRVAVNAA